MIKNYTMLTTKRLLSFLALSLPLAAMATSNGDTINTLPAAPPMALPVCEYPILESPRCANQNLAEVWLKNANDNYFSMTTSSSFISYDDGTAHYTSIVSNGSDTVEVDIIFSGYTTTPPQNSPKENWCSPHDTSDWVYYTKTTGTIISENHGTFTLERKGPAFQLGNGADVTREGFGASGWFNITGGGDGFYTTGDVNIQLGECVAACNLSASAGNDVEVCSEDTVELTAMVENASSCPGGCEYPIEESAKCGSNGEKIEEVWIKNDINNRFVTTSSSFKTYNNGTAHYTSVASNGTDNIEVDVTFSGYTTTAPQDSPKENWCSPHDTSDWAYYTTTTGTIVSELHGTFDVTRKGPAFQIGDGADVTREGFGASGWLMITGGNGYYENGDINIKLGTCEPINFTSEVAYVWTTEDGNIVGDANQKTITVDQSGTYRVMAVDCNDCEAIDEVVVTITDPDAGTITADVDNVCMEGDSMMISATPDGNQNVPEGYILAYVLTSGADLVIQDLSDTPKFTVTESGKYTIHTFVYPASFDPLSVVVPGQTTGVDVNSLLVQGGGELCASLDVAGAMVMVDEPLIIGDFVWIDENQNGRQDDGEPGVNGVTVTLFTCEGEEVASTVTADSPNGDPGYFMFEICPNSGSYYIVFGDLPGGYEFTTPFAGGDIALDSNADENGVTACFEVKVEDDLTIDCGLKSLCPLILQYKIRPRDTDGIYTTGNETAACLGDDIIIRLVMPGEEDSESATTAFTDWVFTFSLANGSTAVRGNDQVPYNNAVSRFGLNEDDFGLYTVSWVSADGCEGTAEFTLNFPDEGCNADGIRANDANKVASIFPMPAKSGSTVQMVITTDTGVANSAGAFPASKEQVSLALYELNSGRMVNQPKVIDITKGRDVINYELNQLSSGVYILRISGSNWTDTKQIVVD